MNDSAHLPVLPDEIVTWLRPRPGQTMVDGTLGGGGHSRLLAGELLPDGQLVSLDQDPDAIERAQSWTANPPMTCIQSDFRELAVVLAQRGIGRVHGILLDLGLSSDQLADATRGFSFNCDGPLDMRFDPNRGESAADLLRRLSEKQLADLIYEYGEERRSRRIARRIVEERRRSPIRGTARLARIVRSCFSRPAAGRIDSATRTFQALRIAVNGELDALDQSLRQFPDLLAVGGRLAIISFHSLEDRRVKHAFRDDDRLEVVTRKPIMASEGEKSRNARSRSAKLRVAERR